MTQTTLRVVSMELVEQAAAVVYAAVRELGLTAGEINRPTWQIAPGEMKSAYRQSVRLALDGCQSAQEIHEAWHSQKKAEGWRFGSGFCLVKREHPLLMPFAELSELQRFQYELFIGIARAFAGKNVRVKN